MTIFFSGCNHFGHEKIIRLANRPFSSVEEMDEVLIERWNQTVRAKDTVYHLGDFAYKNAKSPDAYLDKLNGKIIKLQGNHDRPGWGEHYIRLRDKSLPPFKKHGLVIALMHYPIEEWDCWYRDSIHLHCHTHNSEFISAERRGNVGVDATDFRPISLEEVVNRLMPGKLT